jgi:hypothetical protein
VGSWQLRGYWPRRQGRAVHAPSQHSTPVKGPLRCPIHPFIDCDSLHTAVAHKQGPAAEAKTPRRIMATAASPTGTDKYGEKHANTGGQFIKLEGGRGHELRGAVFPASLALQRAAGTVSSAQGGSGGDGKPGTAKLAPRPTSGLPAKERSVSRHSLVTTT